MCRRGRAAIKELRRNVHFDLFAQGGIGRQAEMVAAPEPAGVVPVRSVPVGQEAHGLIGEGDDFGAVGGFQVGLRGVPFSMWYPAL